MWWIVALATTGIAPAEPSDQTLVYYNARMALRQQRPKEALRLWFLRNTLENVSGSVSAHDDDFHSITWAALGRMGLCLDGFPKDKDGAGLWPLAVHNWVIRNRRRGDPPDRPSAFNAFTFRKQQRYVSIHDVLDARELKTLNLFRTKCWGHLAYVAQALNNPLADLRDKENAAKLLRHLLLLSKQTLAYDKTRGRSVLDARIFDLNLQLAKITASRVKREARSEARAARQANIPRTAVREMRQRAEVDDYHLDPDAAHVLERSLTWSTSEWLALSPQRRLFLFDEAVKLAKRDPSLTHRIEAVQLAMIDTMIRLKDGGELQQWIARYDAATDGEGRRTLWEGERGARLLTLSHDDGFGERAVVALQRGVAYLQSGQLDEALRSMAFALQHAEQSRVGDDVANLSRRWLSFVAAQFEVSNGLLTTLRELVPKRDFSIILEDLMWHAALLGDAASFEMCGEYSTGRGALRRRTQMLTPLARGNAGAFVTSIRDELVEYPNASLRFIRRFVERLEAQGADARALHRRTLRMLQEVVLPFTPEFGGQGGSSRSADTVVRRIGAILQGLGDLGFDEGSKARALSPQGEVFAGSVRLAPSDPLPWPFRVRPAKPPSVFSLIDLTPEEWRAPSGELTFGWRIGN